MTNSITPTFIRTYELNPFKYDQPQPRNLINASSIAEICTSCIDDFSAVSYKKMDGTETTAYVNNNDVNKLNIIG